MRILREAGFNGAASLLFVIGVFAPGASAQGIPLTFPPVAGASLQFIPVVPCRIMDSRNAAGILGGPFLVGGSTRMVPVPASSCGIPPSAAYALNITAIPRSGSLGYLSAWPTGQSQPLVATLSSLDGSILANAAIVPADASGSISIFVTDDTDLVIDINGYFTTPGTGTLQFYPLRPCRVLDTRNVNGAFGGPAIPAGGSRSFGLPSSGCGAPGQAAAYSINVAAVPHGSLGYLTVWPTGQPQPTAATLNSLDGTILANAAIVRAGAGGAVSIFATDTTDVVVDINGYFASPSSSGLNFHTITPCRAVDTRNSVGPLGGPTMNGDTARVFPLSESNCGLPASASGYSLNMAVAPSGSLGYLTTWPTGQSQPLVATLSSLKGLVQANAAIVPAGTGGAVNVYVTNTTDVIIDANGFFGQITFDRIGTFTFASNQITVNDATNIQVGDIVSGMPATVNNLIVPVGSTSINVPNTAMVAVGETVRGSDAATGTNLIAAGTSVVAISAFDSKSNMVTLSNSTVGASGNASLIFDAAPLISNGTVVVAPAPTSTGVVNISAATIGSSGPGIVNKSVVGSPGVNIRFTRP